MNLDPLLDHLEANGIGVPGVTLFRDSLPADLDTGYLLVIQTETRIDAYTSTRRGRIQLVTRAKSKDQARAMAVSAAEQLELRSETLGNMKFLFLRQRTEPLVYPRTEGGQFEASINLEFAFIYTQ